MPLLLREILPGFPAHLGAQLTILFFSVSSERLFTTFFVFEW